MILFAVANHSPNEFLVKVKKCNFVVINGWQKPEIYAVIKERKILISDFATFQRNLMWLQNVHVRYVVFTTVLNVLRVSGAHKLDMDGESIIKYQLKPLHIPDILKSISFVTKGKDQPVKIESRNYIRELAHEVKKESLLNPMMSYIYTLPGATHQKPIKLALIFSIKNDFSDSELVKLLVEASREFGISITKKMVSSIVDIYNSPVGLLYRKAFKRKPYPPDISMYEINYMEYVIKNEGHVFLGVKG